MPTYSEIATDRAVRCRWLPATMNTLGRWCNMLLMPSFDCASILHPRVLWVRVSYVQQQISSTNYCIAHGRRESRWVEISGHETPSDDHADSVSPRPIQSILASPRNISVHSVESSIAPNGISSPPESCSPAWKGKDVVVVWFRKASQSKSLADVGQMLCRYGVGVSRPDTESKCESDPPLV
jgi:hypothetical protein